jgi:hypothetical protein
VVGEDLDGASRRLIRQFPDVPHDAVVSILGDAFRLVVEASGLPLTSKAEELARLRLEVRTRHPALPDQIERCGLQGPDPQ